MKRFFKNVKELYEFCKEIDDYRDLIKVLVMIPLSLLAFFLRENKNFEKFVDTLLTRMFIKNKESSFDLVYRGFIIRWCNDLYEDDIIIDSKHRFPGKVLDLKGQSLFGLKAVLKYIEKLPHGKLIEFAELKDKNLI